MGKQRVPRTRGGGKFTESQYWGRIRTALRHSAKRWPPKTAALKRAKVGFTYIPKVDKYNNPEYYKVDSKMGKKGEQKQQNGCGCG